MPRRGFCIFLLSFVAIAILSCNFLRKFCNHRRDTNVYHTQSNTNEFTHDCILSLGTDCAITYNLRSYFGDLKTGLLDWIVTPLSALPDLLHRRFNFVDNQFECSLCHFSDGKADSIRHMPTGIRLYHDFTRDETGRVAAVWTSEVVRVAEKYAFLGARMDEWLQLARRPLLFINKTGCNDPEDGPIYHATHQPDIYLRIISAFHDTYPDSAPLFCITDGYPEALERVIHRADVRSSAIMNYGDWHEGIVGHYAGCKSGWTEAINAMLNQPVR